MRTLSFKLLRLVGKNAEICAAGRHQLQEQCGNLPVRVICVIGLYRSGKSSILNAILKSMTGRDCDAFETSDLMLTSCTEGIDAFVYRLPEEAILFLDCQGSGVNSADLKLESDVLAAVIAQLATHVVAVDVNLLNVDSIARLKHFSFQWKKANVRMGQSKVTSLILACTTNLIADDPIRALEDVLVSERASDESLINEVFIARSFVSVPMVVSPIQRSQSVPYAHSIDALCLILRNQHFPLDRCRPFSVIADFTIALERVVNVINTDHDSVVMPPCTDAVACYIEWTVQPAINQAMEAFMDIPFDATGRDVQSDDDNVVYAARKTSETFTPQVLSDHQALFRNHPAVLEVMSTRKPRFRKLVDDHQAILMDRMKAQVGLVQRHLEERTLITRTGVDHYTTQGDQWTDATMKIDHGNGIWEHARTLTMYDTKSMLNRYERPYIIRANGIRHSLPKRLVQGEVCCIEGSSVETDRASFFGGLTAVATVAAEIVIMPARIAVKIARGDRLTLGDFLAPLGAIVDKINGGRVLIIDAVESNGTCDESLRGLWRISASAVGSKNFDHVIRAQSWSAVIEELLSYSRTNKVKNVQFWGHGDAGIALIGDSPFGLRHDGQDYVWCDASLMARMKLIKFEAGGWFWFRTCLTLNQDVGRMLARRLSESLGLTIAGHTKIIAQDNPMEHPGFVYLKPGQEPNWKNGEGPTLLTTSMEPPVD